VRASVEKAIASPPTLETPSPIPELSPTQPPKQPFKPKAAAVNTVTPAQNVTSSKDTKKPVAKNKKKAEPVKQEKSAGDSNKPEGPIKAMLRRIAEEIHDNSYEAIIEAIKDKTLMKDLYNAPNNPISVKITEVNTKERTVYLIKQKRGAPEPVTFRLIRKLLAELQL
jgi:predicted lipid-binding transport protein (Tim44 family)